MVADKPSLIDGAYAGRPLVVDLPLAEGEIGMLLSELRLHAPASRTLLLSDYDDPGADAALSAAGADGVVHTGSLPADLPPAIDAVLAGRAVEAVATARRDDPSAPRGRPMSGNEGAMPHGLKERAVAELKVFAVVALYLWLFLARSPRTAG